MVHTDLFMIEYVIIDRDLDRLLDRVRLADRGRYDVTHTHLIAIALDRHRYRPVDSN